MIGCRACGSILLGICVLGAALQQPALAGAGCPKRPRASASVELTEDERKVAAWLVETIAEQRSIEVSKEALEAGTGVALDTIRINAIQPVVFAELARRGLSITGLLGDPEPEKDADASSR